MQSSQMLFLSTLAQDPQSGIELPETGAKVVIRAAVVDGLPRAGVPMQGSIRTPYKDQWNPITFYDDGLHQDGQPSDGIYGALWNDTAVAGIYAVQLVTELPFMGHTYRREKQRAFALRAPRDTDRDGLSDRWETRMQLSPVVADSQQDADSDGLTNAQEWALGTYPLQDDSDGGGESDGSEQARGADPRNPSDDQGIIPLPEAIACDGAIAIAPSIPLGTQVEIQQAPSRHGPFHTAFLGPAPSEGQLNVPSTNGQPVCTRIRAIQSGRVGSWSGAICLTPSSDPIAPEVRLAAQSPQQLRIMAQDNPEEKHVAKCDGVLESGVSDVMVSSRADFRDAQWTDYVPEMTVNAPAMGQVLWVKARDGAGHESLPAYFGR